jgi:hypothetical protein
MKINKLTFVAACMLLFCAFTTVQAQVNKGAIMVGGSISFESSEGENAFKFEPQIGYFFTKSLGAGVNFNIDIEEETQLEFGPFVRYYAWKGLFPQVGLTYSKEGEDDAETTYNFGLGYSVFATPNVAFEPVIRYNIHEEHGDLYLGIGVQAFLGRE